MLTDETELLTLIFRLHVPVATATNFCQRWPRFGDAAGVRWGAKRCRCSGETVCVLGCREQSHTTRERARQGLVHGVAAASYGYAEQKNYCELGVERMSRRTACSPSTRVCARWGRRRSRTAASVLDVRWPETEKTRTTSSIRSAVVRFLWRR